MITKQSNNVLPNLHPLVTYHYGENYNFNACMRMLMEYAEPNKIYSYSFFAGISGDNFVQVYGHKERYEIYNGGVSCVWDGRDLIKHIFGEIGYEYTYITSEQINSNKSMFIDTVKAYIDKGIPVLAKRMNWESNYIIIVGYEENGKTLLWMDGENTEPVKMNTDNEIMNDWIFIGAKKKEIDLRQIYINALSHIAKLLLLPDKYGCSYGVKAFHDWANDVENGRYDSIKKDQFDWKHYSVYICILATNYCGVSGDFLNRVQEIVPEFDGIKDEYYKTGNTEFNLDALGGDFNVTLENLQDKEKRIKIAEAIRAYAPRYENFAKYIKENLRKNKLTVTEKA